MPLQSSGAISLNDIQTEFGGTNPININEYYRGGGLVPFTATNINIPTSGTISLSNFYGAAKVIGYITSLSATNRGLDVVVDSSSNSYITGIPVPNTTLTDCIIAKYNSVGTIQWQRTLSGAGTEAGRAIGVDSSANVYVAGDTNSQSAGGSDALIIKYNTNGVIQWQITLGAGTSDRANGVAVDSSGNVYIVGYIGVYNAIFLAKYNTSGTLQWSRYIGGSGTEEGYAIAVDSTGNCYITGYTNTSGISGGGIDIFLAKYNTNGVIQWQRALATSTSATDWGYGIGVDLSGSSYISGYTNGTGVAGGNDAFILKYDTNGTFNWARRLGNASDNYFTCLASDGGNQYVAGYTVSLNCIIARYNSSGTIQWQRSLSQMTFGWGIAVDSTDSYYVTGQGTNSIITAKFPKDGSATGTYGSYTYSELTHTSSSMSVFSSTTTFVDGPGPGSSVTRTLTDAASSYTSTTTTF